ncbi:hypothetical protein ACWKWC_10540, partial [Geodermatophilus nigrescens]
MTAVDGAAGVRRLALPAVVVAAVAAAGLLLALRLGGDGGFATDPVGALALTAGAAACALAGRRLAAPGRA